MPKGRVREGVCKLTQQRGRFVDSHILPKALTRAEGLAPGLTQFGQGKKERRWSSWYDGTLVIEEGEKILSHYDNWAIPVLRKYRLVWSGWGPILKLTDVSSVPNSPWGIRYIKLKDEDESNRIRLFFLSMLWRAAATKRTEFSEIQISTEHLEMLRVMLLTGNAQPIHFYPMTVTQISTLGLRHNHTPIAMTKRIPTLDGSSIREEPNFRFFLDGMIVHFSRLSIGENAKLALGTLRVGGATELTIPTVRFEDSAQAENLAIVMMESELGRPLHEFPHAPFSSS